MDARAVFSDIEFPPSDRERWLALAQKALAGASFEETLVSHTDDGLRIEPLYDRPAKAEFLARQNADAPWIMAQRIDDTDPARANAQALHEIEQGATGLALVFEGAPNSYGYGLPASAEVLEAVLEGVVLNHTYLRIDVHPSSRAMADWLVAILTKRRVDPSKLNLSFGIDPAAIFAGTGRLRMSIEALQASMPQSLAHFFALGVPGVLLEADGRVLHNAGATEAQELGVMLATAVAHLRLFEGARQALIYAAPHIGFSLSVDQDQFLSMAKIRAMRKLWARVQLTCSIAPSPATIHAETSYRMMTLKDPETNILRTTLAGFAAAAGGATRSPSCRTLLRTACRMPSRAASPATRNSSWPMKAISVSWRTRRPAQAPSRRLRRSFAKLRGSNSRPSRPKAGCCTAWQRATSRNASSKRAIAGWLNTVRASARSSARPSIRWPPSGRSKRSTPRCVRHRPMARFSASPCPQPGSMT